MSLCRYFYGENAAALAAEIEPRWRGGPPETIHLDNTVVHGAAARRDWSRRPSGRRRRSATAANDAIARLEVYAGKEELRF